MPAYLPLTELETILQISGDTSHQIIQFTDQIEDLTPTDLTHDSHCHSSTDFTVIQLRCDEFTTAPAATAPAISTQPDSSRSDSHEPASAVATHREAAQILDIWLPSAYRLRHNTPNDTRMSVTQHQRYTTNRKLNYRHRPRQRTSATTTPKNWKQPSHITLRQYNRKQLFYINELSTPIRNRVR